MKVLRCAIGAAVLLTLSGCGLPARVQEAATDHAAPPERTAAPAVIPSAAARPGEPVAEPFAQQELAAVRLRVVVPEAGIDDMLELTTDDVWSAGGAEFRFAACGPLNAAAGMVGGYTVGMVDTAATGMISRFEVTPIDEVVAAGTYQAVGSMATTDGGTVPLTGDVTILPGLRTGTFSLQDPAGTAVTGDYECVTR